MYFFLNHTMWLIRLLKLNVALIFTLPLYSCWNIFNRVPSLRRTLQCMKICRWKQRADKHIFSFRRIYSIIMGNTDTKLNFRKAVIQLTTKTQVQYYLYLDWIEIQRLRLSKFANMSPIARINKFPIIGILFWHEDILYNDFKYSWYLITRTMGRKYISNLNEFGGIFSLYSHSDIQNIAKLYNTNISTIDVNV